MAAQLSRTPLGGNLTTLVAPGKISWFYAALITLIWAVLAAVTGTGVWATLTAVLEIMSGAPTSWLWSAFKVGVYFGGFIALVLLVPYWGLLLTYAALFARRPTLERSTARFLGVAFLLAFPIGTAVFLSFLDPWSPFGASWGIAFEGGPLALVSAWIGIALPRLAIRPIRPGTWWVAA